jgi:diacylglycerol kinase (ATP)
VSRETVFLVNPASANGATGKRWPQLERRARTLGLTGETRLSERPGHLSELAAQAAAEDALLVVVGGDGSLNEVVNGLAGADAEVAVIPAGTGRDFGRTYGIPARFEDAVAIAVGGTARRIDVGRAVFARPGGGQGERLFANAGSVGMSGAVARRVNSGSKRLGGRVTFYSALVAEFLSWTNTELSVAFEGGERRARMHDAIVANGCFLGGGMKLAPDARPDDGLFDLVLVGDVSKLDFVTTSPKLYRGGHVGHPRIEIVRSPWVSVDAETPMLLELDGEQEGTTPVRFEIVPGALRIRVAA